MAWGGGGDLTLKYESLENANLFLNFTKMYKRGKDLFASGERHHSLIFKIRHCHAVSNRENL